ncbi:telomerase Cajal body protein 1, partial [Nyctibius grandis]|uniref:telomerase Cajal body protein 1 n=1 Tax=Nyctibius grandis TaxID=48427 RepID=UPI0035BBEA53
TGRFLVAGDTDGFVTAWDTLAPPAPGDPPLLLPRLRFRALRDCVNGTSLHPWLPLLATASGQRLFPAPWDSDEEGTGEDGPPPGGDNRLQLWWWGPDPPGDGDCHPPGDTGTVDDDCHPLGDTNCDPPGDTKTMDDDCHPPGDTGTMDTDCHRLGDTDCHPPGDTDCDPPGDIIWDPPGDTGTEDTDCHLLGDTDCDTPQGC